MWGCRTLEAVLSARLQEYSEARSITTVIPLDNPLASDEPELLAMSPEQAEDTQLCVLVQSLLPCQLVLLWTPRAPLRSIFYIFLRRCTGPAAAEMLPLSQLCTCAASCSRVR